MIRSVSVLPASPFPFAASLPLHAAMRDYFAAAPWDLAVVEGILVAVLALIMRTVLDGGVTGSAISFAAWFGLIYGVLSGLPDRAIRQRNRSTSRRPPQKVHVRR